MSQTSSSSPRLLHRLQRGLARLAEAESEAGLLRVLDEFLQELPGIACAMLTVVDHMGPSSNGNPMAPRSRTWLLALPTAGTGGAVAARAALNPMQPIEFPIRPGLCGMLCVYSDPTRPLPAAVDSALLDALRIVTLTLGAHLARLTQDTVPQSVTGGPRNMPHPMTSRDLPDTIPQSVTGGVLLARESSPPVQGRPMNLHTRLVAQPEGRGPLLERPQFMREVDAHLHATACLEAALLRVDLGAEGGAQRADGRLSVRHVAEALCRVLPAGLPAACLRPGEFAVLLAPALLGAATPPPALEPLERRVRAALAACLRESGLREVFTTAHWPRDGVDAAALLRHVRAKPQEVPADGPSPSPAERRAERVSMGSELRLLMQSGALADEMRIVYQPQISLVDMRLCGVEALLRWRSPRFGEVAPAVFVPILEETGLIVPVGEWMFRQACGQVRRWAEQGVSVRRLAVNLTASQLRAPATARALEQVLVDTGLMAWCQFEVEVTESTLMSDADGMVDQLRALTGLGVRVAVDDFGRGTCALGWLESFPISGIKVDPLFLGELDANPDHAQLARAMFDLGRALNLRVSAEGVETASQLDFIRSNGCEEAQGYYLARPLEAEHFVAGTSRAFH